jgi:uncharacterized DUF497 family protein
MVNSWDETKRQATLRERGLDFADAELVFASRRYYTREDDRRDYGEVRQITVGYLFDCFVVIVWTGDEDDRRIISMRHGHAREERRYRKYLD